MHRIFLFKLVVVECNRGFRGKYCAKQELYRLFVVNNKMITIK